jgi:hypothetical protein
MTRGEHEDIQNPQVSDCVTPRPLGVVFVAQPLWLFGLGPWRPARGLRVFARRR